MEQMGIGAMLGFLGGNEETISAINASLNKKIKKVWLDQEANKLCFELEDESILKLWDDGQSCCENRYMRTDDDLSEFAGAILLGFELKNAPPVEGEYGDHEIQFLDVKTDKGVFQLANHNEHNGYYGGFWIIARVEQ